MAIYRLFSISQKQYARRDYEGLTPSQAEQLRAVRSEAAKGLRTVRNEVKSSMDSGIPGSFSDKLKNGGSLLRKNGTMSSAGKEYFNTMGEITSRTKEVISIAENQIRNNTLLPSTTSSPQPSTTPNLPAVIKPTAQATSNLSGSVISPSPKPPVQTPKTAPVTAGRPLGRKPLPGRGGQMLTLAAGVTAASSLISSIRQNKERKSEKTFSKSIETKTYRLSMRSSSNESPVIKESFSWEKDTDNLKNSRDLYKNALRVGDKSKIQAAARNYLDQWTKDVYIPARKNGVYVDISRKIIDDANGNFN